MIDEITIPKEVVTDLIYCIRTLALMISKSTPTNEQVEKIQYMSKVLDRAKELLNKNNQQ